MEEVVLYVLAAAGLGVMWWRHGRHPAGSQGLELAEDAEIALHLARHEARSRAKALAPVHLLYALLQDQALAAAIRRAGGDVEAIEDAVFAALDGAEREGEHAARHLLEWAVHAAHHGGRQPTCADLFGGLTATRPAAAALVEAGGVTAVQVLFTLVHGVADAPPAGASTGDGDEALIVLVNDHITTQEFVAELLRDVFGLSGDDATARMLETHTRGRGEVGRYRLEEARARAETARRRARARGYPLWIRLEPANPGAPRSS